MAIIKCKMCGGDMELSEDRTVGFCEYCGSTMTLPRIDDDQRAAQFNRGNHFRRQGEFDKALAVYERIVAENDEDAEAHWCCALCRFGIEYVHDPNTYEYLPTCHRASFDSFLEDVDYLAALEHSDGITNVQYRKDAAKIAEVQRGILATSQNEEPYDVFICYKETDDETKERTRDSIDAQEIYYQLTQEGYRVFFSRITLEDKAGTEYEPYIFAALNSSKVMIAIGSRPEYFNAVWVKNEWSRFLAMMRRDRSKLLLPCYKGMDPYDMPEQLGVLQSYDMAKIGFVQDLIRGVRKVLQKEETGATVTQAAPTAGTVNVEPLLKRAFMFLEDSNWEDADTYCERVLDQDPENAKAYLGKLMAELRIGRKENLKDCEKPFDGSGNYSKIMRFGDEKLRSSMLECIAHINERNENKRLSEVYGEALETMRSAADENRFNAAAGMFASISGFRDADVLARECSSKAEEARLRRTEAEKAARERLIAEQERQKAERIEIERKAKLAADALLKSMREKQNPSLEEALAAANRRIGYLGGLLDGFDAASQEADGVMGELEDIDSRIAELTARRASLGLFAGKEKKKLEEDISALSLAKNSVEQRLKDITDRTGGYQSKLEIERDLYSARVKADELNNRIAEKKSASEEYSLEEAVTLCSKDDRIAMSLRKQCLAARIVLDIQTGSPVFFGSYPQDANGGREPIEWIVLDKNGTSLLLISRYALDCQKYNGKRMEITWENCSLRKWLNGTFLSGAFTSEERAAILNTTVIADWNPSYDTHPGNNTKDKVFLLSITEANKCFRTESERHCQKTAYANTKSAYTDSCWWWLRSPGGRPYFAATISNGTVIDNGTDVDNAYGAIRPALRINLES